MYGRGHEHLDTSVYPILNMYRMSAICNFELGHTTRISYNEFDTDGTKERSQFKVLHIVISFLFHPSGMT